MPDLHSHGRLSEQGATATKVAAPVGLGVGIANGITETLPFWVFFVVAAIGFLMVIFARRPVNQNPLR